MGKGGAPTTTQTVQNQNVAYTPTGLQGFQDIYNRASGVASQPYQPYTGQLVQGLNPTQTGAISNISNIASQPLTAGQIQQYMNPFQGDVINATMANIDETNRQQMAQTTGQLTQAAGGVGASRIALGQGELARQQALASNQTLAGLNQQNYAQGLAAAQQQQGFGLGAAQSQLGAGGLEQQTGQAGLTAQYQQYLQALAFPYQQTQFLAGVGLPALGAMGGQQFQTGTANQTMTPPGVSWLQALTGAGAIGAGFLGANNSGGGNSFAPQAGTIQTGGDALGVSQADMANQPAFNGNRGGGVPGYADGGGSDDDPGQTIDLGKDEYHVSDPEREALAGVLGPSSYVPTASSPKADEKVPSFAPMQAPASQGGSGSGSGTSALSGLASLGATAAKILPFFALKRGGHAPSGYDDGGSVGTPPGMGMAYPTPAMMGSPLTRGALPQAAQMNTPQPMYGQPLPNLLPPHPVTPNQAAGNIYANMQQALQQQQLGMAMAAMRNRMANSNQQQDDSPHVSVNEREYAQGGPAVRDPFDRGNVYKFMSDQRRDQIDSDKYGETDAPIRPGRRVVDPEGRERDVRQLADGGPSDDDSGSWATSPDNPIYNFFHPAPTFEDRWPSPNAQVSWRTPDMPPAAQLPNYNPVEARSPNVGDIGVKNADYGQSLQAGLKDKAASTLAAMTPPKQQDTAAIPPTAEPTAYPTPGAVAQARDSGQPNITPAYVLNPNNFRNEVPQRQTVRGMMNNPDFWMRAGLNILAANPAQGAIGAIASGVTGTVGQYDKWSKDDMTSMQKGQELAEKLMTHADKFTKLTANEKAHLNLEQEKLKETQRWHQSMDPVHLSGIISRYRTNHPQSIGMSDEEVAAAAIAESGGTRSGQAPANQGPPPGVTVEADPGQGNRQVGHWYIGPSGKPQKWLGGGG